MKAVIKSLVLVLASGSLAIAQTPATRPSGSVTVTTPLGSAEDEAVHRQYDRTQARVKLEQARDAELRKDLPLAAKLYDDAWGLADNVGPLADAERQMAAAGIASVRMQLAQDAERRGDYDDASRQVGDVLRVDPRNQMALAFNTINNQHIEATLGTRPSRPAVERAKVIHQEDIDTSQLIQDGKLLYQLGRSDEAELKFQQALDRDPNNSSALYYLSLCKQKTAEQAVNARSVTSMNRMVQVEKQWADNDARLKLPVPNPYAATNMIYTSPQRQQIYDKLNSIMFDKISFPNLQLSEVIKNLAEQTQHRDIDQQGINFILNKTKPPAAGSFATPGAPGGFPGAAPVVPPTTFDPTTGQPIRRKPKLRKTWTSRRWLSRSIRRCAMCACWMC